MRGLALEKHLVLTCLAVVDESPNMKLLLQEMQRLKRAQKNKKLIFKNNGLDFPPPIPSCFSFLLYCMGFRVGSFTPDLRYFVSRF